MILKRPYVEFVEVDTIGTTATTSEGTGGVDSCNGPTSRSRNCNTYENGFMVNCGIYDQETKDGTVP